MKKFLTYISPLISDGDKLSTTAFWTTIILVHCLIVWFGMKEIPTTEFQVLILLLGYRFGTKAVYQSKNVMERWVESRQTPELLRYKAQASKAAKDCDQNIG
ncbi:hypothetical protein [Fundidesulfovibrio putealis]|uniref:hypothetical protein n=1 Tax=Fundidesulfovibrio putealis TaxID=270496 RepID=UPI0012EC9C6B|nr:hypothetical protein [Fundidesulfovibrio putealis]